jgi:transcriptional regulator with XRE-family HTH domain
VNTFAEALRALLDERNVRQAELARRLGLSAQSVSAWITGSVTPTRENVVRIEDELAVDPRGSLLALAGYASDGVPEPTVESLIRVDPGLDPEDKRVILRIIRMARERYAQANQGLVQTL